MLLFLRKIRVIGYVMFALSGAAALVWPSPSIRVVAAGALVYIWSSFWLVGGSVAAIGAFTDRWIGELVGLPLLAAVFTVFGLAAFYNGRPTSIATGLGLIAISVLLVARWRDVDLVRREAARRAEHTGE